MLDATPEPFSLDHAGSVPLMHDRSDEPEHQLTFGFVPDRPAPVPFWDEELGVVD